MVQICRKSMVKVWRQFIGCHNCFKRLRRLWDVGLILPQAGFMKTGGTVEGTSLQPRGRCMADISRPS